MPNYGSSRIRALIITATGGTGPAGATGLTGNTGSYVTGPTGPDGVGIVNVYSSIVDQVTFEFSNTNSTTITGIRGNTGIGPAPVPIVDFIGSGISPLANTAGIDTGYTLQFRGITLSSGLSGSISGNTIIIETNIQATGSFDIGKLLEVKYSETSSTYYLDSADDANYKEVNYSGVSYSNFEITRTYVRDVLDSSNFNYSNETAHDGLTLNIDSAFYGMTGLGSGLTYSFWNPYLKYRTGNFDVNNTDGVTVGLINFSPLGPYTKKIKPEESIGSCCYCDESISDPDDRRKCIDYVSKTYCESIFGRWNTISCSARMNTYDCYRRRACCVNGLCINTSKLKCDQMNGIFDGNNECGASYDCERKFFGNPVAAISSLVCCCINGVTHSDLSQSECESLGGISTLPSSCEGVDCCQYQNIGACCLSDGTCEPLTAYECSAKFGLYKGTGTSCNPNPCCLPTT